MRYSGTTALAAAVLALPASAASAQGTASPTVAYMCGLLTKAQVEKVINRKLYSEGEGVLLASGAVCDWGAGEAQVMLFTGPKADANWEAMLERFGHKGIKRTPVPGLGAPAYVVYPPPKNEYQETVAMVVLKTAPGTLVVSSAVNKGEPAQKALGPTIELVKLVLPKLK